MDVRVAEAFASCCGVNLAFAALEGRGFFLPAGCESRTVIRSSQFEAPDTKLYGGEPIWMTAAAARFAAGSIRG
jgi:hypothetical protein